jgi:hypothetical protein
VSVTFSFLDALQRQALDEVAFYPRSALERGLERGEIVTSFENGEPCGYLWHGPARGGRDLVIYQAVVHYDLRRRHHGLAMLARVAALALSAGSQGVRCRCRSSIPANDFWQAAGFRCIRTMPGGKRRGADINVWRLAIQPEAFALWVPASARPETRGYVAGAHNGSRWNRRARALDAARGDEPYNTAGSHEDWDL